MGIDMGNITTIIIIGVVIVGIITLISLAIPFILLRSKQKKAQDLLATGVQGEATVLRLDDTGMRINENPRVSLLLEVRAPGNAPYQIVKTVTVEMVRLPQIQPGSVVAVLVDPLQPSNPDRLGLLLK